MTHRLSGAEQYLLIYLALAIAMTVVAYIVTHPSKATRERDAAYERERAARAARAAATDKTTP